MVKINKLNLKSVPIPVPDKDEQKKIVLVYQAFYQKRLKLRDQMINC
ncbi:restriction endonuclease subunit S [bacterium]|nr:restriction endonuclease subunit S [bacterium]